MTTHTDNKIDKLENNIKLANYKIPFLSTQRVEQSSKDFDIPTIDAIAI